MKLVYNRPADVRSTVIAALKTTRLLVTPHASNPNCVVLRVRGASGSHLLTVGEFEGSTILRASGRSIAVRDLLPATLIAAAARCFNMARGVSPDFSRALTESKEGAYK